MCFTDSFFFMSLQELWLLLMAFTLVISILYKWSKSLLIVINLEALSSFILVLVLMLGVSSMFILLLFFLVSEALITLSSLYSAMRLVGSSYSTLSIW